MDTKKVAIIGVGVLALAGIGYGIYRAVNRKTTDLVAPVHTCTDPNKYWNGIACVAKPAQTTDPLTCAEGYHPNATNTSCVLDSSPIGDLPPIDATYYTMDTIPSGKLSLAEGNAILLKGLLVPAGYTHATYEILPNGNYTQDVDKATCLADSSCYIWNPTGIRFASDGPGICTLAHPYNDSKDAYVNRLYYTLITYFPLSLLPAPFSSTGPAAEPNGIRCFGTPDNPRGGNNTYPYVFCGNAVAIISNAKFIECLQESYVPAGLDSHKVPYPAYYGGATKWFDWMMCLTGGVIPDQITIDLTTDNQILEIQKQQIACHASGGIWNYGTMSCSK